jgi:hypothetical protein
MSSNLTDVNIDQYWHPPATGGQNLINEGTGELTHRAGPLGVTFHLSVTGGNRPAPLQFGQLITASGIDSTGTRIIVEIPLETVDTGNPAIFTGNTDDQGQ